MAVPQGRSGVSTHKPASGPPLATCLCLAIICRLIKVCHGRWVAGSTIPNPRALSWRQRDSGRRGPSFLYSALGNFELELGEAGGQVWYVWPGKTRLRQVWVKRGTKFAISCPAKAPIQLPFDTLAIIIRRRFGFIQRLRTSGWLIPGPGVVGRQFCKPRLSYGKVPGSHFDGRGGVPCTGRGPSTLSGPAKPVSSGSL